MKKIILTTIAGMITLPLYFGCGRETVEPQRQQVVQQQTLEDSIEGQIADVQEGQIKYGCTCDGPSSTYNFKIVVVKDVEGIHNLIYHSQGQLNIGVIAKIRFFRLSEGFITEWDLLNRYIDAKGECWAKKYKYEKDRKVSAEGIILEDGIRFVE